MSLASVSLRVLIVEDSAADAELIVPHLEQAGYAPVWNRVEIQAQFVLHHGVLDPQTQFLQKPFTSKALARKVRSVLR